MRNKVWNLLLLSLVLALCACGGSSNASWQEQYDLGIRYLEQGNYEEAIIAFNAAIEIDPKRAEAYVGRGGAYVLSGDTEENLAAAQADYEQAIALDEHNAGAYLGLADVYIRRGDYDKAMEILRQGLEQTGGDQAIADKINELESALRMTAYDAGGAALFWHDYTYDEEGREIAVTSYDAAGAQTGHVDLAYDGAGNKTVGYQWSIDTGAVQKVEFGYDGAGNAVTRTKYSSDGTVSESFQYDGSGRLTREDLQGWSETDLRYRLFTWDPMGYITEFTEFDRNSDIDICIYTNERESGAEGVTIKTMVQEIHAAYHATAVYRYDGQGRLTGLDKYDPGDELQQSVRFSYTGGTAEAAENRNPVGLYEPGGVFFPILEIV